MAANTHIFTFLPILSSSSSSSSSTSRTHSQHKTSSKPFSPTPPPTTKTHLSSTPSPKLPQTTTTNIDALLTKLEHRTASLSRHEGAQLHAQIIHLGLSSNVFLSSKLLYFYFYTREVEFARHVFNSIPETHLNQFFWNTMIRAYVDSDRFSDAVELFLEMVGLGFLPNEFTYPFVIKSCSVLGLVDLGKQVHGSMIVNGFECHVFAVSALLDCYVKCGWFMDACKLFDRITERNDVIWNAMVSGYAQNGYWEEALEALELMGESGIDVRVSSWNSIMAGCVRFGDGELALETLRRMSFSPLPVKPNSATFNTLLPVISTGVSLINLKELHAFSIRQQKRVGLDSVDDDRLRSSIASGYACRGCIAYASRLFEQVHLKTCQLWISMISGHINCKKSHEAFSVFRDMIVYGDGDLKTLSKVPLTLLLPECSPSSSSGLEIHAHAYRVGFESNTSVSNALIAMYARRGDIKSSERVFVRTHEKDVVTWNSMIYSYTINSDFEQAIDLLQAMHSEDVKPDRFTFSSVLSGCGELGAHRKGIVAHGYVIRAGFSDGHLVVQNALMDMYGKCGCVEEAQKLFDEMEWKDDVSWNTIITCYGLNARPYEAFSLFYEMQEEGWKPNRITFITLLSACSHAGLVDEGLNFFQLMKSEYGIVPDVEHYTCIVDSLGRMGRLNEAYNLIKSMPIKPDDCVWSALLGGCRIHGNVSLAEIAARHLIELKPQHPGYHVLLSNVYKDAHRRNDAAEVRETMKDMGVRKIPGFSWIEVCGEISYFTTGDTSHKQSSSIYLILDVLTTQLMVEGYSPDMALKDASSVNWTTETIL